VTQEAQANPTSDASSLRDLVNDLDVVFHLRKPVHFRHVLKVQEAVVSCLLREKYDIVMSPPECYKHLFKESLHVHDPSEQWSLISLGSDDFTIDLKVVYKASRHYAFSIDSFEVVLNSMLQYRPPYKAGSGILRKTEVEVRSTYGNYEEALEHLTSKKLCTRNPGGIHHGLFRYCLEIARGNRPENVLYDLVFTANFYEEFETANATYFHNALTKFVNKHKKHWYSFLSTMRILLLVYAHERSAEFIGVIHSQLRKHIENSSTS